MNQSTRVRFDQSTRTISATYAHAASGTRAYSSSDRSLRLRAVPLFRDATSRESASVHDSATHHHPPKDFDRLWPGSTNHDSSFVPPHDLSRVSPERVSFGFPGENETENQWLNFDIERIDRSRSISILSVQFGLKSPFVRSFVRSSFLDRSIEFWS